MKLILDTVNKHVMVSMVPVEKTEQNGRQKAERGTGRPMWSTQVIIQDSGGADVILVTTAGVRPDVTVGQVVTLVNLEALPWATNGRNGVAYRAESISAATGVHSVKSA